MAEHQKDGYIPLKEIARRQEISEKYLESIIKLLVKDQVLEGLRGKAGDTACAWGRISSPSGPCCG